MPGAGAGSRPPPQGRSGCCSAGRNPSSRGLCRAVPGENPPPRPVGVTRALVKAGGSHEIELTFLAGAIRAPNTSFLVAPSFRSLHNKRLYLAVFAAVLGNFSFGFALVYPSPVIPALEAHPSPALRLDQYTASWFGVRSGVVPAGGRGQRVDGGSPDPPRPLSASPHSQCSRWERRRGGSAPCSSMTAWDAS